MVGCCCCSAWLGLGELCVFVTVSAREYRREFVLVCVAEYFSRSSYDIRFAIPSGRLAASLSRYTLWFKKNAPTLADYNYDPVQSILIIFSKLFDNDHKSCLVVKFSTSPHICCHYTL